MGSWMIGSSVFRPESWRHQKAHLAQDAGKGVQLRQLPLEGVGGGKAAPKAALVLAQHQVPCGSPARSHGMDQRGSRFRTLKLPALHSQGVNLQCLL